VRAFQLKFIAMLVFQAAQLADEAFFKLTFGSWHRFSARVTG